MWRNIVQELIDNAEEEKEREDSTPLDFIRTSVVKGIDSMKRREYNAKEEFAKGTPITDKGELIIRAKHIEDILKFDRQPMKPREVTNVLKSMGFKSIAYGEGRLKAWTIDYEKFKSGGSE